VIFPTETEENISYEMEELANLADTAGAKIFGEVTQRRVKADSAFFIGKGKAESIVNQAKELECNIILFNDELSPTHVKNLQKLAGEDIKVLDRTGIILDIFSQHVKTKESRKQVELARLEYMLPRLTRQWTHLERQMGGIGMRGGPGETQIEIDRRLIRNQISKLKKDLERISQQRSTQNQNRKSAYKVALVGYTNAGKSTLLKAITGENVYIQDKLFATLDTTTRRLELAKELPVLLSDTVGFIHKLPHNLVASFRSTLSEVNDADLLLKVVDCSSPHFENHLDTISEVMTNITTRQIDSILVFNKIDKLIDLTQLNKLKTNFPEAVFISAEKELRIQNLLDEVIKKATAVNVEKDIIIPYEQSALLDQIYSQFNVINRIEGENGFEFKVSGKEERIEKMLSLLKRKCAKGGVSDTLE
jgi:GTPase